MIFNLRLGFATNSSSSHSILLLGGMGTRESHDDGYGWSNFTLGDTDAKLHYLGSQLGHQLGYQTWGDDVREENLAVLAEIERLTGIKFFDVDYVDHQSTWAFPREWFSAEALDREFVQALVEFLSRDDVTVLGGNDNSDDHPLAEAHPDSRWWFPFVESRGMNMVARDDGTHWVFFDRRNGNKARFAFAAGEAPQRGYAPELVDIKITDYCPFGCPFCYQDSTPEGRHASLLDVTNIARRLGEAKVFEVAIGGGEPTLHPDFAGILEVFKAHGIVANFTTKNLAWLNKGPNMRRIAAASGSFAYSVQTLEDVEKFIATLEASGWIDAKREQADRAPMPTLHIVMGTVTEEEFRKMLALADIAPCIPVTLLGWKHTGRADEMPEHPYMDWWLRVVRGEVNRIGIDTALAAEAQAAGQLDDVPKWMYHTTDGPWSCYIDAVNGTLAPSSWQPERGSWTLGEQWLEQFRSWEIPETVTN